MVLLAVPPRARSRSRCRHRSRWMLLAVPPAFTFSVPPMVHAGAGGGAAGIHVLNAAVHVGVDRQHRRCSRSGCHPRSRVALLLAVPPRSHSGRRCCRLCACCSATPPAFTFWTPPNTMVLEATPPRSTFSVPPAPLAPRPFDLGNTLSLLDVVFEIVVVEPYGASVISNPLRGMPAGNKMKKNVNRQPCGGVTGKPGSGAARHEPGGG